jgi:hypothetical protein
MPIPDRDFDPTELAGALAEKNDFKSCRMTTAISNAKRKAPRATR